jgi:aminoglycoside phosphotransferase family enzyme/predicted kinase
MWKRRLARSPELMTGASLEPPVPTQAELVEALSQPGAYPHTPAEVELVQTHLSLVFLAGERVYKVKKPLDLGFADYSTLERRQRFSEAEVRLNRRLAPDAYLGVVPITRGPDGTLRVSGRGETVEVAVEMRRLPAERMLDRLLVAGEIDNEQMESLAGLLVRFHSEAATGAGVDEYGRPMAVAFNVRENFEQTKPFAAPPGSIGQAGARTLSPALHAFLAAAAERFLGCERVLLERRVREGRIREGHGDLHAGNVCFIRDGIVVYDCIEFAARLRCGDVACDLAFLAMDLDYRRFRGFSRYLVRAYAERAGDLELERLIGFYKGYRAIVRAKVASLAAVEQEIAPAEQEHKRLEAMRYFHLAAAYELPPSLILTCGLPASGKSTAARRLGEPFEAAVLRSDTRRKHLAGMAPTQRASAGFEAGIYTPDMTDRVYRELLADAGQTLRVGRSVVVDASFRRAAQREPFLELAGAVGAATLVVETVATETTIRQRMEARALDRGVVSDADFDVYLGMREAYDPPDEVPAGRRLRVEPGEAGEETTARAIDLLVDQTR